MTCNFNPTPTIRIGQDNKIEWSCTIEKTNKSEDFKCVTELYDAYNMSYLIQVNPSYDDYKSKTTILGGGNENDKINKFFEEDNNKVIVYYDGGVFNDIKPTKKVEGHVQCSSDTQSAYFIGNTTPLYPDYNDENIFRSGLIINNTNIIIGIIILILITGFIFTLVVWAWKKK